MKLLNYIDNISGSIAPLTAIMLPLLIGVTAVGIDVSVWMQSNRNLQAAVDAAAIAGAMEYGYGYSEEEATAAALKEAINNGFQDVEGNHIKVIFDEDENGNSTVRAELTGKSEKYFAKILFEGEVLYEVAASTAVILPNDDFCMLSLAPTGTSMLFNGNVTIESEGCGLAVNSSDPNAALNVNGKSSDIKVGDVSVVGGIDGEEEIDASSINTGVPPFKDPYENLDIPSYTECTKGQQKSGPVQADGMEDLPAPDFDGVRVLCGGLLVKNNKSLELDPGVYIIDGGDLEIKGELTGEGVTLILTNSGEDVYGEYGDVDFTGDINLSAPLPNDLDASWDEFEGIVIYQDRDAPAQTQCNDFRGNNSVLVDGVIYLPSRCLDIGGNSDAASEEVCSRIIALNIKIHGNPNMANSCEDKGVEDIIGGNPTVRLIL